MDPHETCSRAATRSSLGFSRLGSKDAYVNDVEIIMAQLFELKYNSIGNLFYEKDLYHLSDCSSECDAVELDPVILSRIVSMIFFWGSHLAMSFSRGSFSSSKDWMNARFQLMEGDCRRVLNSEDADQDDIEDMEIAQQLLNRIRKHLESFFPLEWEEFLLFHDDISRHNLIVDSKGKLPALVDWECVSVMPFWEACQIPSFIDTLERTERPNSEDYMRNADGFINSLYHEHLDEYECTSLRGHFLKEMTRLAPQWIVDYQTSGSKIDFDHALQNCDGGMGGGREVRLFLIFPAEVWALLRQVIKNHAKYDMEFEEGSARVDTTLDISGEDVLDLGKFL